MIITAHRSSLRAHVQAPRPLCSCTGTQYVSQHWFTSQQSLDGSLTHKCLIQLWSLTQVQRKTISSTLPWLLDLFWEKWGFIPLQKFIGIKKVHCYFKFGYSYCIYWAGLETVYFGQHHRSSASWPGWSQSHPTHACLDACTKPGNTMVKRPQVISLKLLSRTWPPQGVSEGLLLTTLEQHGTCLGLESVCRCKGVGNNLEVVWPGTPLPQHKLLTRFGILINPWPLWNFWQ